MKAIEIDAVLVSEDIKLNPKTGDKTVEKFEIVMPVTTEVELDTEAKQLALEYTLKVLAELGFQIVITEEAYKRLDKIAIAKSFI